MSWTYSGNPGASSLDKVRFEIGDTISTDQLLSNEEINYVLGLYQDTKIVAMHCCKIISRNFSRQVDYTLGPQSVRASQRAQMYLKQAEKLEKELSSLGGVYLGNIDTLAEEKDEGYPRPAFKRDLMNNT
jgi:hypothetical protein